MLRVALADLRGGAVETVGEIPAGDPLFASDEVTLVAPVAVRGRLSRAGEGQYYWQVAYQTVVRAECRRCLATVDVPVDEKAGLVFATDPGATETEGYYVLPARAQDVDLREPLREELLLALPRFVECRPDCRGLCPTCGANLNDGPCGCGTAADPRWDALRALTKPEAP
jgi:uncharacterized protein